MINNPVHAGGFCGKWLSKTFHYRFVFAKQSPLVWFAARCAAYHTFPPLHKGGFTPRSLYSTVLRNEKFFPQA